MKIECKTEKEEEEYKFPQRESELDNKMTLRSLFTENN
jgi:hypothetical protein